ncbi:hypothetical protein I5192_21330 (plasmid) [Ruegeria sp. SCSIO 43209]|uniref:hypothetical protein n=1 Tax=Ruegeria sp. SCSIO 43209 TaxID=2793010 RepID=UPI00147F48CC|nr:hypothetical protein [Ruegeria sp. SCSIO 43209]UAB91370.1 hypothetical protein I5192_21330 [Ruegeria sp. SCSIO 43209]
MTRLHASLLLLCLAVPSTAQSKMADVSCDDSARMAQTLKQVLGAERQGMGLRDPETMLEVWVKRTSGDWMIVQNYANGTSCIVAMGDHWQGEVPDPA